MASEERLRELEEKYEDYTVYDNQGSKIGKVDDLFVDEKDHEEYIGVKLGFLGRKSTLIPTEIVRVNEGDRTIEVSESKDHVKDAPSFDDDEDVTAEYEERIRSHFGLESLQGGPGGSYGASSGTASGSSAAAASGAAAAGSSDGDDDRTSGSSGYAPEGGGSGSSGGSYEQGGGSGGTEERHETSGSSSTGGDSGTGSSGSQPTTTRQTEETETFQEGGRTKVRRRIIREEVVDADDQGSGS